MLVLTPTPRAGILIARPSPALRVRAVSLSPFQKALRATRMAQVGPSMRCSRPVSHKPNHPELSTRAPSRAPPNKVEDH